MKPEFTTDLERVRTDFEELVKGLRPELHRYCTRMVGSAIDGEDVLQEALAQAFYALARTKVTNMRGWLVRIAHNKAIDFLRRSGKESSESVDELPDPEEADDPLIRNEELGFAIAHFLKLTPLQRSSVILKDIMGYSLGEISELLGATIPEVKALLHRGRKRLREIGESAGADIRPRVDPEEIDLLGRYVDRFSNRDYDAVRKMLAEDVRLNIVGRTQRRGAEVKEYFTRYEKITGRIFKAGMVEGRPAVLVYNEAAPDQIAYLVLLDWHDGRITLIRDYLFVPYIAQDLNVTILSD